MTKAEENDYNSDEEINPKHHSRFLDDVLHLDKKQYVKKPTRTEPTTHVSEFNLVKTASSKRGTVNISDLTKGLVQKHVAKKIKDAQTKTKTLRKPLEKPQVEKIKRTVGFKSAKLDLDKWDPIVIKNRVSSQLKFPLNDNEMHVYKNKKPTNFQLSIKSELDKELEKLETVVEKEEEPVEVFPLSLKEILEKRREMARLRAHQSYQEAKAYRQNKIKSKKFHRIQRKEKIKNQIKEFEKLQKTDPDEALKKLDELDKTRAEERMSLRHRSTGQWAKNKQIRAKYDTESRQVLAQQLAISRELTQKLNVEESSDSETEVILPEKVLNSSNPWVKSQKTDSEINDFVSGYRKFWDEKNKNVETNNNKDNNIETNNADNKESNDETQENANEIILNDKAKESNKHINEEASVEKSINKRKRKSLNTVVCETNEKANIDKCKQTKKRKLKKTQDKEIIVHCNTAWSVTPLFENKQEKNGVIEDIFEDLQCLSKSKLDKKLLIIKKQLNEKEEIPVTEHVPKKKQKKNYLDLPREKLRPEIDEELGNEKEKTGIEKLKNVSHVAKPVVINKTNIDPDKFLSVKSTPLTTVLPDNVTFGEDNSDNEADDQQKAFISEAFIDDDVVSEFTKEKKDLINKGRPQNVDLTLPGWGEWAGKTLKPSRKKRRRFVIQFPKVMPRRDENKGKLIINEEKGTKLKQHQVAEMPFPFKSVKEFEASIRAPIGDTFVPQTAFRRLIKPSVVTKKGAIIQPMDEEVLVRNKFTKQGMVVKAK